MVGVLVAASAVVMAAPAQAVTDFTVDGITYAPGDAADEVTAIRYDRSSTTVDIPDSVTDGSATYRVTAIGPEVFKSHSLKVVTIGDNVTEIGKEAFHDNNITELSLGTSIATIGPLAFDQNRVRVLDIPASVTGIGGGAFSDNNIQSLTLHEGLTTIGDHSFSANLLDSVVVPASVASIGAGAFAANYPLSSTFDVTFAGAPPTLYQREPTIIDGHSYDLASLGRDPGTIVHYRSEFAGEGGFTSPTWQGYASVLDPLVSFELNGHGNAVPEQQLVGTPHYPYGDFVVEPTAPTAAGWEFGGWFSDAAFTTAFDFTEALNIDVTLFAQWRFTSANGIRYEQGAEPGTVTAVDYDQSSSSVVLPASIDTGGEPYRVTAVGAGAFDGAGLDAVVIGDNVTDIGSSAFATNNIDTITIPTSVTAIGGNAFSANSLATVAIATSVQSIGARAFADNALTSISLPDNPVALGAGVFADNALTSVAIPSRMTSIPESTFESNRLGSVDVPASVTDIGARAFADNILSTMSLHDGLNTIGDSAFQSNALTALGVPASVTSVGASAFADNPLTWVVFAGVAPTTITPSGVGSSLGSADGLTVHYLSEFAAEGGFPVQIWQGYTAVIDPVVSFDVGGHGADLPLQPLVAGQTAVEPTAPVAEGWTFGGWFGDDTLLVPFDFRAAVSADRTLFAKWTADPLFTSAAPPAAVAGTPYSFTFEASGSPTFAVTTGQLPAGLTLSAAGVLSGTPTSAGSSTLEVTASNGATTALSVTLTVEHGALTDVGEQPPTTERFVAVAGQPLSFAQALGNPTAGSVSFSTSLVGSDYPDVIDGDSITFYIAGVRRVTAFDGSVSTSFDVVVPASAPATLALEPSAMSAIVGDSVTLFGTDAYGNSTGDLASQAVFTSDWKSDVIDGATVTFGHASVHTITGRLGGLTSTVAIELSDPVGDAAAATQAAETATAAAATATATAEKAAAKAAADAAAASALARTGVNTEPGLFAGVMLLVLGLALWTRRRRGRAGAAR